MKKEEEIETIFIGKEFTKIYNENTFINTDDFLENIDVPAEVKVDKPIPYKWKELRALGA